MAMGSLTKFGLLGSAAAAASLAVIAACGLDPPPKNTAPIAPPPTGCVAEAGTVPTPNCDNSSNQCTGGGCAIDEAKCGPTSTCLPIGDNKGKTTLDFRMRRLNIATPPTLSQAIIQKSIVTKGIDLKGVCGDDGDGGFNWLLRIDKTAGTLTTGGAPPSSDPLGTGYCFYNHTVPSGITVAPTTAKVTFNAAGDTFDTEPADKLNMATFLNGDPSTLIVLPLTKPRFTATTITEDGNCIGAFNASALDDTCTEDPSSCPKWKTAGIISGYFTLEDADKVPVDILKASLCILLTKAPPVPGPDGYGHCPRDAQGKISLPPSNQGDFCSTTNTPHGCGDSFWFAATFAAAAVKISNTPLVPECQSGVSPPPPPPDGGSDAATDAPADAGGD